MKTLLSAIAAAGIGAGAASSAAAANWPASVVGSWGVIANQDTNITLTITSQGNPGDCKVIKGTLVDPDTGANDAIQGFYCPGSGRIAFLRHVANTKSSFQSWSGNLSLTRAPQLMGGTFFDILNVKGEYEWYGSSQNR